MTADKNKIIEFSTSDNSGGENIDFGTRLTDAETRLHKILLYLSGQKEGFEKNIIEVRGEIKKIEGEIKKVEDSKINIIEIIGIFVTIFTFVSTNINIFTKIDRLSSGIWFMFLMFLCLSDFLILLHIVSSSLYGRDKNIFSGFRDWWIVFFSIMALFILTMIFTGKVYDILFIRLTF